MPAECFQVTGALGCLGAWTVARAAEDYDDGALRALIGTVPRTPLPDALRQTRAIFERGRLTGELAHG
jgi:hypothetical protein